MIPSRASAEGLRHWERLAVAHQAYVGEKQALLQGPHRAELAALIRHAFERHIGMEAAAELLPGLHDEERKALLPVMLAPRPAGRHADVAKAFVAVLPREWLLQVVEEAGPPFASGGLDWAHVLGVYEALDPALAQELAARMVKHVDADIARCGQAYLLRARAVVVQPPDTRATPAPGR